jgi:hypothetical protein
VRACSRVFPKSKNTCGKLKRSVALHLAANRNEWLDLSTCQLPAVLNFPAKRAADEPASVLDALSAARDMFRLDGSRVRLKHGNVFKARKAMGQSQRGSPAATGEGSGTNNPAPRATPASGDGLRNCQGAPSRPTTTSAPRRAPPPPPPIVSSIGGGNDAPAAHFEDIAVPRDTITTVLQDQEDLTSLLAVLPER